MPNNLQTKHGITMKSAELIVDFPEDSSRRNALSRKSVRFSPTSIEVRFDRPTNQVTAALWTSREEKKCYRTTLIREVEYTRCLLRRKDHEDITKDEIIMCVGIENLLSESILRFSIKMKERHIQSVLNAIRCDAGDEFVRCVSEKGSEWSVDRAHSIAKGYFNLDENWKEESVPGGADYFVRHLFGYFRREMW